MPASRTITRRAAVATLFSTAGAAGVAAPPEPFEDRSLIRSTYLFQSRPPMTVSVMPVLRVLPGQRLICIWVSGGDSEPLDVNRPLISTSDDLGRTWSDAREFPAIEGRMTFCCEIEHQDGLTTAHLFSGRAADGYRTVTNHRAASRDLGRTWSALEDYHVVAGGAVFSEHLRLSDGTVIYPFFTGHRRSAVWIHRRGEAPVVGGHAELADVELITPRVVELPGGRLVMLLRAQRKGYLFRSDSTDGGLTWSRPVPTTKPSPTTRFWLRTLSDGRQALIDNPTTTQPDGRPGPRNPLELWLSSDGMATWSRRIVLDRGEYHGSRPPQKSRMGYDQQLAYPEAVEHRGKLYVAYDYNRRDVVFLEVNLERIA